MSAVAAVECVCQNIPSVGRAVSAEESPAPRTAPGRSEVALGGFGDVPCLRTLWTVDDLEFDRLTFFQ